MTAVLKGVIFDMDGVIIESEYTHYRAICHAMGSQLAVSYDTFVEKCTGADERFAMGRMAELSGIDYDEVLLQQWSSKKADAYRQLVSTEAKAMPGAMDLVESTASRFPIALATGSRRSDVDAAFEALAEGRLPKLFHTIVTSSDVERPKPDPSTYQNAVDGLGLSSENCLAIEDSPNGVRSAKGAGLRVLGVSAMHGAESLSAADWCVSSLEKISITDLIYLFQSYPPGNPIIL
jgi:beta-phosphoglucomutase